MSGALIAATVFQPFGVALSGSSSVPVTRTDFQTSPTDATVTWSFNSNGTLRSADPWEWYFPVTATPSRTYYVRATLDSGDTPDSGDTLNTWHALSSTRAWTWTVTGLGTSSGTLKIEIANDSGGSDIVATGYYKGTANVSVEGGG